MLHSYLIVSTIKLQLSTTLLLSRWKLRCNSLLPSKDKQMKPLKNKMKGTHWSKAGRRLVIQLKSKKIQIKKRWAAEKYQQLKNHLLFSILIHIGSLIRQLSLIKWTPNTNNFKKKMITIKEKTNNRHFNIVIDFRYSIKNWEIVFSNGTMNLKKSSFVR